MTVEQLIKILETHNPEMPVVVYGVSNYDFLSVRGVHKIELFKTERSRESDYSQKETYLDEKLNSCLLIR